MIILSARKEELEDVIAEFKFVQEDYLHTLVNGKKAGLYKIRLC